MNRWQGWKWNIFKCQRLLWSGIGLLDINSVMNQDIFQFQDYRTFLQEHSQLKKSVIRRWSLSGWSKKLGFNSTSSLTKILNGEREPGKEATDAFIQYFNFNLEEELYFRDLIRLSKVKADPILKSMMEKSLGKFQPARLIRVLDDRTVDIIKNWYVLAIREMVALEDFQNDLAWIQARLAMHVSQEEIKHALEILLHQGLIEKRANGKLVQTSESLQTRNDKVSLAIQQYHTQMLDNAKVALKMQRPLDREFCSETIVVDKEKIPEAKEFIRNFKAEFARLFETQQGNETYQLQIQLFSLTKEISHET